ncbi:Putative hydrolase/MSMEI_3903 [Methylobacterium crusticola]|uniref:Hydrolase/MSMEI_3903 n=1 Tax=Methylobacterium crusticola TaxID=1697972 RepID=A0ABQ4QUE0_9HYPH|nr:Zn-dependent hydrolase [Methylobacterium crusticola]GJD48564.1 Putative hydrolase/MSMEI_3903 [Methylobacterium crusticola]
MRSTSSAPEGDPAARLLDLLARFSACGATPAGGVTRLCGSPADGAARGLLARELAAAGARVAVDAVGNQFGHFALAERAGAPLVMMGSHLDSQVRSGRLDGTLGVAAALGVGRALMAAKAAGAVFDADFCAVNWTNEEGARFRPSLLGSGTYAGHHDAAFALSRRDDDGVSLGEALAGIGYRGEDAAPAVPACYLELHVEQGSVLEQAGAAIGVVTRCWGALKRDVVFTGEQAHTGPTAMPRRRDALLAGAYLIAEVRAIAERWPGLVHTSVGRVRVAPNSANVVPARVELSLEVRSADDRALAEAGRLADAAVAAAAARARVEAAVASRSERPIRALPAAPCDLVALCAAEAEHRSLRMDTVAGHDALSLLGTCPTGIVFVPSLGGIAHNEAEATDAADLAAGLAVMTRAAHRLCRAGGSPERASRLDRGEPT